MVEVNGEPVAEVRMVHAVSIKIPAFMETAASGWFAIIEAQFDINKITVSATKFSHVLSNLPPDLVIKLAPELLTGKNYENLKEAVIAVHEQTKPELYAKLISGSASKMTGRPSYYLQELQSIASKVGVGEDLIRHQFLQALPTRISPVLAAQKTLSLSQLGTLADELMPFTNSDHVVQHVSEERSASRFDPRQNVRNNQSNSSIPYGLRPFSKDQRPKVCRWHLYYGTNSRSCKPWCTFPDKNGCKILPRGRSPSPATTRSPSLSRQEN